MHLDCCSCVTEFEPNSKLKKHIHLQHTKINNRLGYYRLYLSFGCMCGKNFKENYEPNNHIHLQHTKMYTCCCCSAISVEASSAFILIKTNGSVLFVVKFSKQNEKQTKT